MEGKGTRPQNKTPQVERSGGIALPLKSPARNHKAPNFEKEVLEEPAPFLIDNNSGLSSVNNRNL